MDRSVLDLSVGQWAYIKSLEELELTCKLLTLGILPKSKVEFIRKAPFGGALYLKINDHIVAVREDEAAQIKIE
jgi:ferrous iron transport protein A